MLKLLLWIYIGSLTTLRGATVINFDDLPSTSNPSAIQAGYDGFQWNNFGVLDASTYPGFPRIGMVSSNNIAVKTTSL